MFLDAGCLSHSLVCQGGLELCTVDTRQAAEGGVDGLGTPLPSETDLVTVLPIETEREKARRPEIGERLDVLAHQPKVGAAQREHVLLKGRKGGDGSIL